MTFSRFEQLQNGEIQITSKMKVKDIFDLAKVPVTIDIQMRKNDAFMSSC